MMEGGVWGLVIILSAFMIQVLTFGTTASIGVYNIELLDYFEGSPVGVSLIGSINFGVYLGSGPIVSFLMTRYCYRKIALCGSVMVAIGLMGLPFLPYIPTMCLFFGVLTGFGNCCTYIPSHVLTGLYYDKYRSIATGVSTSGSGLGGAIMPVLVGFLIDTYSWRGSLICLAGLNLHLFIFAALLRYPPMPSIAGTQKQPKKKVLTDEYRLEKLEEAMVLVTPIKRRREESRVEMFNATTLSNGENRSDDHTGRKKKSLNIDESRPDSHKTTYQRSLSKEEYKSDTSTFKIQQLCRKEESRSDLNKATCQRSMRKEESKNTLDTPAGKNTLDTPAGKNTLDTPAGKNTLDTPAGKNTLDTPAGKNTLDTPAGKNTLDTPAGKNTLDTPAGKNTLDTPAGKNTLDTPAGKNTLDTPAGKSTLDTPAGKNQLRCKAEDSRQSSHNATHQRPSSYASCCSNVTNYDNFGLDLGAIQFIDQVSMTESGYSATDVLNLSDRLQLSTSIVLTVDVAPDKNVKHRDKNLLHASGDSGNHDNHRRSFLDVLYPRNISSHSLFALGSRGSTVIYIDAFHFSDVIRSVSDMDRSASGTSVIPMSSRHVYIFTNYGFNIYFLSNIMWNAGYAIIQSFAPEFLQDKGLSLMEAAWLSGAFGFASFVGGVVGGILGNFEYVNRQALYTVACVVMGAVTIAFPQFQNIFLYTTTLVISGLAFGVILGLLIVVLTDLVGVDSLGNGLGYLMLSNGLGTFIGPPIASVIKESTGGFDTGIVLAGGLCILGGLIMLMMPLHRCCRHSCQGKQHKQEECRMVSL
ncbi:uncharacterized protein LOC131927517 [Physella acuta]|uniref:uncharacterized protein LOC131927517 n=1 Tax=Physella acuta TaxID=109671 RepID=UPI0027DB9118|nr:uncharacterized protein LOC131927517 [Physella acuta]